jgi:hypothetical protein
MSELTEKIKEIRNNGSRKQAHIDIACKVIKEVKDLERQLAEAREAICIHVREHMDCGGIDNDDEAVIYFKNTFNEKNYN